MPRDVLKIFPELMGLEPVTRAMAVKVFEKFDNIHPTSVLRTNAEQNKLFAQGRFTPGKVVTNAKAGQTPHNEIIGGLACGFDFAFKGKTMKEAYPPEEDPRWQEIGQYGESIGLNWGGPNGKGDRFAWDRPHFERKGWKLLRGNR